MNEILHITSGDCAGEILVKSGIHGEVFVWHDILYDGPRNPGWPDDKTLEARSEFLESETDGGLDKKYVLKTLKNQYEVLTGIGKRESVILWFDACLFDQSMLVHILACLNEMEELPRIELLCVDSFPGINPFNGLGQLEPTQMASLYEKRSEVTKEQFQFAKLVDKAFATQDQNLFEKLSKEENAALPWVPAAVTRWLQEYPNSTTGLGRLESLALDAIRDGAETLKEIFSAVAAADTPPQYWGDTMLWVKLNALAERSDPLVRIDGPSRRIPQWETELDMSLFRIKPL